MNKLPLIAATALLWLFTSCASREQDCVSETTKKNIASMHGIFNCFNTNDFSKLGDYVAEDCIDHSGGKSDLKGLAQMKAEFEKWMQMVENSHTTTAVELATDEYVISWVRFDMTMKSDVATKKVGEKFEKSDIEMLKFRDGKAIEHWTFIDARDMDKVLSSSTTGVEPTSK
jgi:predicted ester cyclase